MALHKVKTEPEIARAMETIGYQSTMLAKGDEYLRLAMAKYEEILRNKDKYKHTHDAGHARAPYWVAVGAIGELAGWQTELLIY